METKNLITVTCHCGTEFQTDEWNARFRSYCKPCQEIEDARIEARQLAEAEAREVEAAANRRMRVESCLDRITPARMADTDINDKRFNGKLWRLVGPWKPTAEKPWLGLVGETGSCKTRIAFLEARQLAARLATRGPFVDEIHETTAGEFQQIVRDLTSWRKITVSSVETTVSELAADRMDELKRADILIFDEIGKIGNSPSIASTAFTLIDHRHRHKLITIWTSNRLPEEFCAPWHEEFAGPTAGRIIEASTIFTV